LARLEARRRHTSSFGKVRGIGSLPPGPLSPTRHCTVLVMAILWETIGMSPLDINIHKSTIRTRNGAGSGKVARVFVRTAMKLSASISEKLLRMRFRMPRARMFAGEAWRISPLRLELGVKTQIVTFVPKSALIKRISPFSDASRLSPAARLHSGISSGGCGATATGGAIRGGLARLRGSRGYFEPSGLASRRP